MADKKTDRRTMKTRKAIFEGIAELLTEKELRNITVQELADRVDIHRVTFYKHFMDIYDVYDQLENAILSELGILITEHGAKTAFEVYPATFKYIKDNPKYSKMIFSPHSSSALYWKVQKLVEGLNRVIWSESFDVDRNDSRIDCAIRYHSNGSLAIVGGWVQSDFAQPEAFIAEMLSGLDESTQSYLSNLLKK